MDAKRIYQVGQELISDTELNDFLRSQFEINREYINNRSLEYILPELWVVEPKVEEGGSHPLTVFAIAHTDFNEKRWEIMKELGHQAHCKNLQPIAVFLCSEAWTRKFTEEESKAKGNKLVADYEDKEESLIVSGLTLDGRVNLGVAKIERIKNNTIKLFKPKFFFFSQDIAVNVQSKLLHAFYRGFLMGL